MKTRLLLICCLIVACFSIQAQDSRGIALSAYVPDNCGVPPASKKILEGKLTSVITKSGFSSVGNQRFILTAKVDILTEDITDTAPVMYVYTLNFDLYIGDGVTGTLFANTRVQAKGVGVTKDKAYMKALKGLNVNDPSIRAFVYEGKDKIVEYYERNGAAIIKRAETLGNNQQFESALWELSSIPESCSFYVQANETMARIYQKQVTQQGDALLAEARTIWNASQDREAADKAGAVLAQINPQSPAYKSAQSLYKQIASRVKALDSREWSFKLQQYRDKTALERQEQRDKAALERAEINAARDVAVAWAQNQPKTVYNIVWW